MELSACSKIKIFDQKKVILSGTEMDILVTA